MRTVLLIIVSLFLFQCSSKLISNNAERKNMVLIKGGRFKMGSDSFTIKKLAVEQKLPYNYISNHGPVHEAVCGKDSLNNFLQVTNRRVIRGGSWGGEKVNMMVGFRDSYPTTGSMDFVGFRCVKDMR